MQSFDYKPFISKINFVRTRTLTVPRGTIRDRLAYAQHFIANDVQKFIIKAMMLRLGVLTTGY